MTKKLVLVVACALIDADDRILLAQRPSGKSMAGLWEFPGGKVEVGETPEESLIRELREELDVETKPACLAPLTFASHAYDDFHLLMPLFICRRWWGGRTIKRRAGVEMGARKELARLSDARSRPSADTSAAGAAVVVVTNSL